MSTAVVSQPTAPLIRLAGQSEIVTSAPAFARLSFRARPGGRSLKVVRRASLKLLVFGGFTVLVALLLELILADGGIASLSAPAGAVADAIVKTEATTYYEQANPAPSIGHNNSKPSSGWASALGSMGDTPTLRSRTADSTRLPVGYIAGAIAEGFVPGAGSAGTVGGTSTAGGTSTSGVFAILLALGVIAFPNLSQWMGTEYCSRLTWVFSRPLVRPG